MHPYAVVSAHLPNALPTERLYNLRVTHQSQVTRHGLSYEAILFYSATVSGETFHCAKIFVVAREEGPVEGLFDKEPAPSPPEIQNSTTPPYDPGDPIKASISNVFKWSEDISLVRNQGLEVDDDTELDPDDVPLVENSAADTLFEGQTWGWGGIDRRAAVSQNQNYPSFKNGWIP